jgi:uncharacterized protein (TIGR03437 family)
MGQRFRLKANFDTSSFPPQARIVLQALKTYGMMVADNGGNWYISGAPHPDWDDEDIDELKRVRGSDFEAVDTSSLLPPSDVSAPTVPASLTLSALDSTQIGATWAAAEDNIGAVGYRVSVSTNPDFSDPLTTYAGHYMGNALSGVLSGLSPSTTYFVRVLAYDEAGNVSSGATASITTPSAATVNRPAEFSIANAASFQPLLPVAPGSLASLFVPYTGLNQSIYAVTLPLPRSLGNVSLLLGGTLSDSSGEWIYSPAGSVEAPLTFAGPGQVNFQVPSGIVPGDAVPAQLTRADGTKALATLRVAATGPGVFTAAMNGQGQAAVLNEDSSFNQVENPAPRGSVVQVFGTGAGDTFPSLNPGEAAPSNGIPLVVTQLQPIVTIGGLPGVVHFSGIAPGFAGLWQVNVEVPLSAQPGPSVPVVVSIGGATARSVVIAVE